MFSTPTFMKFKLHNRLTTHLPLVVHMFVQCFYTIHNSHTKSALSSGEVATIAIVMMGKV
jgi:hypothetical protein